MSDIARSSGGYGGRRFDVLQTLQATDGPLSIAQIADELGVHPNTVRFHLDTLLDDGQVELAEPDHRGRGRPALMFQAVQGMDRGGIRRYRLLAEILTVGIAADEDPSSKALAAGRAWGQRLEPLADSAEPLAVEESVDRLVELCDELGFASERRESDTGDETRLALRHCPFLELAETSTDVVCPIHLGLMQGALEAWRAPVVVDRLDAFAEPGACVAHLRPAPAATAPAADRRARVRHLAAGQIRVEGASG